MCLALTGKDGGALALLADVEVRVPWSGYADRIQEMHIKCIHAWIDAIEQALNVVVQTWGFVKTRHSPWTKVELRAEPGAVFRVSGATYPDARIVLLARGGKRLDNTFIPHDLRA